MGRNNYMKAGNIKTKNSYMQQVLLSLNSAAKTDKIFVYGEMGTGKDSLVNLIHQRSALSHLPLVKVDCEKAKYDNVRPNNDCVSYFDNIHLLGKGLQKTLAAHLDSNPDLYVIMSANEGPEQLLEKRILYDELAGVLKAVIELPPLYFRKEDIPSMIRDALKIYIKKYRKYVTMDSKAMQPLIHYNYRGHITELYSIIERAVLINNTGFIKANTILSLLDADSLGLVTMMKDTGLSLKESVENYEKMLIIDAVSDTASIDEAAALLSIGLATIYKKCAKYGILLDA